MFKSEAQRKKLAELVAQGKMKKETFDEWSKATGDKKLPERVTSVKGGKPPKGDQPEDHFDVIRKVLEK